MQIASSSEWTWSVGNFDRRRRTLRKYEPLGIKISTFALHVMLGGWGLWICYWEDTIYKRGKLLSTDFLGSVANRPTITGGAGRPHRYRIGVLWAPETAWEGRGADWAALAGRGISGRAAVAADPVIALIVTEDVAAWAGGELRPTAFEDPVGRRRCGRRFRNRCAADMTNCRLGHARGE